MTNSFTVIIPNRYPDVIAPLVESINKECPFTHVVIIADGHNNNYGFTHYRYTDPKFVYAKSVNIGMDAALFWESDVILLNDDTKIINNDFFNRLSLAAYIYPKVGILSPLIMGCVGNPNQRFLESERYWKSGEIFKFEHSDPVCFPCVYIKHEMIEEIGLLDESFTGYGGEDNEYCDRARKAGWRTAITSLLVIQHGDGSPDLTSGRGKSWSVSFARRENEL